MSGLTDRLANGSASFDDMSVGAARIAELEALVARLEAECAIHSGIPQGAAEPMGSLDSSIDILARYIIWQQVDPERVEWEDWPDLGEFDFERLVKRVAELAPPCPDMHERQDAHEYLKGRANTEEADRG